MRETFREKGTRYLTEGRLILVTVDPDRVIATCRGEGSVYRLGYAGGRWWCDCPARSENCAHVYACKRVVAIDLNPPRWIVPHEQDARIRANNPNGANTPNGHDFEGRR